MSEMNLSIDIDADPETVFDVIADIERSPTYIEGIEKVEMLTEGSVGVGTRWRETRVMMKKEAVEEMEVTAFESPSHYSVHCDSCGYVVEWTFRVEPSGGGSKLTLVMTSTAQTLLAKLMAPLCWLTAGMMKKCVEADMRNIKDYIEKQPAKSPVAV